MKAQSVRWRESSGWSELPAWIGNVSLVVYFGTTQKLSDSKPYDELRKILPQADILGCSTGSQINDIEVDDDIVSAVFLSFDSVRTRCKSLQISSSLASETVGKQLAHNLMAADLGAVLVVTDGLHVNGTGLVRGMTSVLGEAMPLFGGLAGDGAGFDKTLVGLNEAPQQFRAVAIGFYGEALRVSQAAAGGWDPFGPQRTISAAEGNVLYELDGKPALDLYERYLGDEAEGLPGTALLYPLCIWDEQNHPEPQVRTVLSIDAKARTMTFAGDIPLGWSAQLMRGSHERLVQGAAAAALVAKQSMDTDCQELTLALLVSCVGRRLLMGTKTNEEAEAVADVLGASAVKFGFYSYGEIAPRELKGRCDLHNQTMAVTLIGEAKV
jgi:hypothetical protein